MNYDYTNVRVSEIFGSMTFSISVIKEKLPKTIFKKLMEIIERGGKLDSEIADAVAHAMKEWALSKGVTH